MFHYGGTWTEFENKVLGIEDIRHIWSLIVDFVAQAESCEGNLYWAVTILSLASTSDISNSEDKDPFIVRPI